MIKSETKRKKEFFNFEESRKKMFNYCLDMMQIEREEKMKSKKMLEF